MNSVFDYFLKKEIPSLILCTPNKTPVASLGAGYNIQNSLRYNAMSSLELDFPKSIDRGETTLEAYSLIKNKMLILVEGVGYYSITECPEDSSGTIPVKHISCSSLETELLGRRMTGFSGTFNLYNSSEPKGTLLQIVVDLFPGWSVGYVDPDLENVYRTFESDNSTLYKFLTEDVSTAYSCIFTFNTFEKEISTYLITNLNDVTGVYVSFNNISQSVTLKEYSDEICTALYCYGRDGLNIDSVNPLGRNVIYNFDYYKNTNWMTQDLINAITVWEDKVEAEQPSYALKLTELLTDNANLTTLKSDLEELEAQLAALVITLEAQIAQKLDTTQTRQDIIEQNLLISDKNQEIAVLQNTIDSLESELRKTVNSLQFTTKTCLKNFLMDISTVYYYIDSVINSWKINYSPNSTNPIFSVPLLEELTAEIQTSMSSLNDMLLLLKGRVNLNIDNYPASSSEISIIREYMDEAIYYLNNLDILLTGLIPNTSEVVLIRSCKEKIDSYYTILDYESNFTEEQNIKLQSFIYENTYTNENIILTDIMTPDQIQAQAQILYNQGVSVLARISLPRFEFSGDFVNFLALQEFSDFITEIDLGKIITIEIDENNIIQAALLEIDFTYDQPTSFNMTFSNKVRLNSSNFIFADMFGKSSEGASGVSGITSGETGTITSISASSTSTNILNLNNAQISALGYLSFGAKPPKTYGNYQGIWMGYGEGARLSLYSNENNYLQWDGTKLLVKGENFTLDSNGNITANNADLSGSITALSGSIGGWAIMENYLYAGSGSSRVGMDSSGTLPTFYAGSDNPETAPFRVYSDGTMIATNALVSGSITVTSASLISGWTITSACMVSGCMVINGETPYISMGEATGYKEGIGVFMGLTSGCYVFFIGDPDGDYFTSDGSALNIGGTWIAGWTAGSSSLSSGTGENVVSISSDGGTIPAFSAGGALLENAPFRVYHNGALYATSASIVGSIIASSGSIGGNKLDATSISSTEFVSGALGKGWKIESDGDAEFQNITARGTIKTSVFEKDTISAINGVVLISKADVLDADMTAQDDSALTIKGETTFAVNEILRIKDGTNDEWMIVTDDSSAPTYVVTRDIGNNGAGDYSPNSNPIWTKGTAVVSMGVGAGTKTGYVLLDSSSANSPYIDIYGRNGTSASDVSIHGRYGYLGGIVDTTVGLNSTDVWGLYTDNAFIRGTIVATSGNIGNWVISDGKIVSDLGSIILSGSPAYMSFGSPPPTSASVGTGMWIDKTGLYGLNSNGRQITIDGESGNLLAGNNDIVLSNEGLIIENLRDGIRFKESGSIIGFISSEKDEYENTSISISKNVYDFDTNPNMVLNGAFDENLNGWACYPDDANPTYQFGCFWSSGCAILGNQSSLALNHDGLFQAVIYQEVEIEKNTVYEFSVDIEINAWDVPIQANSFVYVWVYDPGVVEYQNPSSFYYLYTNEQNLTMPYSYSNTLEGIFKTNGSGSSIFLYLEAFLESTLTRFAVSVDNISLKKGSTSSSISIEDIGVKIRGDTEISGSLTVSDSTSVGQIRIDKNSLIDKTVSGNVLWGQIITGSFTGGSNVFGDACYIGSTGSAILASASTIGTATALLMSISTNGSGVAGNYALPGSFLKNTSWTWTPGSPVFLSGCAVASGSGVSGYTLTQAQPTNVNNVVQIIGIPFDSTTLYFYPQLVQVEHI